MTNEDVYNYFIQQANINYESAMKAKQDGEDALFHMRDSVAITYIICAKKLIEVDPYFPEIITNRERARMTPSQLIKKIWA